MTIPPSMRKKGRVREGSHVARREKEKGVGSSLGKKKGPTILSLAEGGECISLPILGEGGAFLLP